MMPSKLLSHRTMMSFSRWSRMRWVLPSRSYLRGSRFFSSSVDDREEESVISSLLAYGRRKQLKSSTKATSFKSSDKLIGTHSPSETALYSKSNSYSLNPKVEKLYKRRRGKADAISDQPQTGIRDQPEIKNLMKMGKNSAKCYIISQEAADVLMKHIKKDLKEGDIIAEADPGPGILTKTILDQTNCEVVSYESNSCFSMHLRSELAGYGDRLKLSPLDLLKFYGYYVVSIKEICKDENSDKLNQLLKPLPSRDEQGVSSVKIVGSLSSAYYFRRLALSYTFQCCFFEDIFPDMYFYVPDIVYRQLMLSSQKVNCRKVRLPFIYYFDIKHLDDVPISCFYAGKTLTSKRHKGLQTMHLIKVSPKKNVHEIVPESELLAFHFFLHHLNRAKKGELFVFCLEKFIPGCGIDFIKEGFSVFDHPRQLSPERLLDAYNCFKSLPLYEECMFQQWCKTWTITHGLREGETHMKLDAEDVFDVEAGLAALEDSSDEITDEGDL